MATCAFDTGFDSGFEICVAVEAEPDPRTLRGVPAAIPRPRKRPEVRELAGTGRFSVIGAGTLTADASIDGWLFVETAGSARATNDALRILIAQIRSGAEASISGEAGARASVVADVAGVATLMGAVYVAGSGAVAADAYGAMIRDSFAGGRYAIRSGAEAALDSYESDEMIILMAAAVMGLTDIAP